MSTTPLLRVRCTAAICLTAIGILIASLAPASFAQEPAPVAPPTCRKCESTGVLACKDHRGPLLELEHGVAACSVAIACRRCAGVLEIDCPACDRPDVAERLTARREELAAWLAERRAHVDRFCKADDIEHLRTEHVDLTFSFGGATVDKRKLDQHERMHLYGERIEAVRRRFMAVLELSDADFPEIGPDSSPRLDVNMFGDLRDMREMSPRLTGIGAMGNNIKLTGGIPVWCVVDDPRGMKNDIDVHRVVVHNVTHLLLSNMLPARELGPTGEGWLDEGIAHWFEMEVDGRCSTYCVEEAVLMPGTNWKNGSYRVGIRQLADAGALLSFVEVYQKNSDDLDLPENAHAYAWVDYLMTTQGGPKLAEFARRLKRREPQRDAMKDLFGFGPLEMDAGFSDWVKLTYPPKELRR